MILAAFVMLGCITLADATPCSNPMCAGAECYHSDLTGSDHCYCPLLGTRWAGAGQGCVDIDECVENTHDCLSHQTCVNVKYFYVCYETYTTMNNPLKLINPSSTNDLRQGTVMSFYGEFLWHRSPRANAWIPGTFLTIDEAYADYPARQLSKIELTFHGQSREFLVKNRLLPQTDPESYDSRGPISNYPLYYDVHSYDTSLQIVGMWRRDRWFNGNPPPPITPDYIEIGNVDMHVFVERTVGTITPGRTRYGPQRVVHVDGEPPLGHPLNVYAVDASFHLPGDPMGSITFNDSFAFTSGYDHSQTAQRDVFTVNFTTPAEETRYVFTVVLCPGLPQPPSFPPIPPPEDQSQLYDAGVDIFIGNVHIGRVDYPISTINDAARSTRMCWNAVRFEVIVAPTGVTMGIVSWASPEYNVDIPTNMVVILMPPPMLPDSPDWCGNNIIGPDEICDRTVGCNPLSCYPNPVLNLVCDPGVGRYPFSPVEMFPTPTLTSIVNSLISNAIFRCSASTAQPAQEPLSMSNTGAYTIINPCTFSNGQYNGCDTGHGICTPNPDNANLIDSVCVDNGLPGTCQGEYDFILSGMPMEPIGMAGYLCTCDETTVGNGYICETPTQNPSPSPSMTPTPTPTPSLSSSPSPSLSPSPIQSPTLTPMQNITTNNNTIVYITQMQKEPRNTVLWPVVIIGTITMLVLTAVFDGIVKRRFGLV